MNLMNNELILKYFRHCRKEGCLCSTWFSSIAEKVLAAMQQPIRKGERYLVSHDLGKTWDESILTGWPADDPLHPYCLRLPDAFQKPKCFHTTDEFTCTDCKKRFREYPLSPPIPTTESCGCPPAAVQFGHQCKPKDVVEEKIRELLTNRSQASWGGLVTESELRDLVRLARETK